MVMNDKLYEMTDHYIFLIKIILATRFTENYTVQMNKINKM